MTNPPLIANVTVVRLLFEEQRVRVWYVESGKTKTREISVLMTFRKIGLSWPRVHAACMAIGLSVRSVADDKGRIGLIALVDGEGEEYRREVSSALNLAKEGGERFYFNVGWLQSVRKKATFGLTSSTFPKINPLLAWAFLAIAVVSIAAIFASSKASSNARGAKKPASATEVASLPNERPTIAASPKSRLSDLVDCFKESDSQAKTRDFHLESITGCLTRKGHVVVDGNVTVIGGLAKIQIRLEKPTQVISAKVAKIDRRWNLVEGTQVTQK